MTSQSFVVQVHFDKQTITQIVLTWIFGRSAGFYTPGAKMYQITAPNIEQAEKDAQDLSVGLRKSKGFRTTILSVNVWEGTLYPPTA